MKPAQCHPNRAHKARGLCKQCYEASDELKATRRARYAFLQRNPELSPPRGARDGAEPPQVALPAGLEEAGRSVRTDAHGQVAGAWSLQRRAGADAPPVPVPDSHHLKSTAILQRGDGSITQQWTSWDHAAASREQDILAAWARHAELYAGAAKKQKAPRGNLVNNLLTLYPLGDKHIGMLAWAEETGQNFDTKIAVAESLAAMGMLVDSAAPSEDCVIANLGDFFHAQDNTWSTPGSKNKLDGDGRMARVLDMGHALFRGMIDLALAKHKRVIVRNIPGNHDPLMAAPLAMWLSAWYRDEPRVIIADAFMAHQYDVFGKCLIGYHHGDRTPAPELALIMMDRARDYVSSAEYCYVHCGHVHHRKQHMDEHGNVIIEYHRVTAPADHWHAARYVAGRDVMAITYDAEFGEVGRKTVSMKQVHRALGKGARTSAKKVDPVFKIR